MCCKALRRFCCNLKNGFALGERFEVLSTARDLVAVEIISQLKPVGGSETLPVNVLLNCKPHEDRAQ